MTEDLIMLCDELEKSPYRILGRNRINFVRMKLEEYIGEDEDKLLELKAQLRIQNAPVEMSMPNIFTIFINVFSLCLVIVYNASAQKSVYFAYATFGLLLLVVVIVIFDYGSKKFRHRKKWIKYIEIVIENWGKSLETNEERDRR